MSPGAAFLSGDQQKFICWLVMRFKTSFTLMPFLLSGAEAPDDLLFDLGEHRKQQGHQSQVVRSGRARQHLGALRGQRVTGGVGVVLDDASGGHAGQPLSDVALVEPGGRSDLLAGGRCQPGHRVQQAGLMPDADRTVCFAKHKRDGLIG